MPFEAEVLGVAVMVESIHLTEDEQIVAVCVRGGTRQRIAILDLPLSAPPGGAEGIEALPALGARNDAVTTVDERQVRLTADEAQANLRTMLELCSAGQLRCSEKTGRPASATVASVAAHLVRGDIYRLERIASFAWPLLLQAG